MDEIEDMADDAAPDPADILSAIEEELGAPLFTLSSYELSTTTVLIQNGTIRVWRR